jgi:hypothetical protein
MNQVQRKQLKWKRIGILFLTLVFVLPVSLVSAGAGEWDPVGSDHLTYRGTSNGTDIYGTDSVNSGGGDFKVCISSGSPSNYYTLVEYDPSNADDIVSAKWISSGGCAVWSSIGGYVDGDNNKAEFYVTASKAAYAYFYD